VARRRGSFSPRSSGQRRLTAWEIGPASGSTDGAPETVAGSGAVVMTNAVIAVADGLTIVRVRGEVSAFFSASSAAQGGFHGAIGLCIVNENAAVVGVSAMPHPVADQEWDGWLFHRWLSIISAGIIDTGVSKSNDTINTTSAAVRFELDSKAMRKFPADQVLVAIAEWTEIGTATMRFSMATRVLVKLP